MIAIIIALYIFKQKLQQSQIESYNQNEMDAHRVCALHILKQILLVGIMLTTNIKSYI
jgi:hypothetical protein